MFLLDTNIWLELMLGQQRADEVRHFMQRVPASQLFITDFAVSSIGIILFRAGRHDAFTEFVRTTLVGGGVSQVRLEPMELSVVTDASKRFGLDFDDAYQYVAAANRGLTLVSYDADLDRTDRGRQTPAQVLAKS